MFDCSKVVPKKCQADCCYYVPIPDELWEKHKDKAQAKTVVVRWNEERIIPLTESMKCPFNDKDFRCVIYEDRPDVCRFYGNGTHRGLMCPYFKPSGNKRGKKERNKILKSNEKNLNRIVGRINRAFELKRQGKTDEEIFEIMGAAKDDE